MSDDVNEQQATNETEAEAARAHFASPGHYTDKDREKIAPSHFAGPNKTYPIEVPQDVEDAARLVGHADDPEAVKARIKAIAHELGAAFVAKLPAEWTAGESAEESERAILAAYVTRSAQAAPTVDASEFMPDEHTDGRLFAPITRIDTERREVTLTATSEAVDSYGTRFSYEASKDAFARWAGNIREMHQPKAVGVRVAIMPDDEKRRIQVRLRISKGAEDTWQKVLDGTLRGGSIGANKVVWEVPESRAAGERPIPIATKYDLAELSLVDNASNPDANDLVVVRVAGADADGVMLPDADLLDELADVEAPAVAPEPPAEAPTEAPAPIAGRASEAVDVRHAGWIPAREDYATFLARTKTEAALGATATRVVESVAPEPAGMTVTEIPDPVSAPAIPAAQQQRATTYAPSQYPDHIRAAAQAAGEEAVAALPGYIPGVSGEYTLYLAKVTRARGAAEARVYAEYRDGERAARAALASVATVERASSAPDGSNDDADGDNDGDEKAPALSASAKGAKPAAAKADKAEAQAATKEATAEQQDADSIPDDGSGVTAAEGDDEAPRAAGITTASGLQGYEMDSSASSANYTKLNGTPAGDAATRHRHTHGGGPNAQAQIHTSDHEHTHANGVTHSHPHAHGHSDGFAGGEHSHYHNHQHAFRNGQPIDTRLLAPETVRATGVLMSAEEERAGLSMTGLKSNVGVGGKADAQPRPSGQGGTTPQVGASASTKGGAKIGGSPILNVSPQKVGALSVVDTEEPMARDGGVPEAGEPEATPDDLTLNGEDFHEGGHPGYSQAGNTLDIDGDHDEPGDGDEVENGKQGEADSVLNSNAAGNGALQGAAPSLVAGGRPTPKNSGAPSGNVTVGGGRRAEMDAEEQRIGARISGASRERLHRMRDTHRGGMLDAADLCGCPECKGILTVLNGGMLDMGQDADHDSGQDEQDLKADDTELLGNERVQRSMQKALRRTIAREVAQAVNSAVRGLFAETVRVLTQSQAEHLTALEGAFADARNALETRVSDLELGMQDAASQLAGTVELRMAQVEQRVAAPEPSGEQAPVAQLESRLETRFVELTERTSAATSEIVQRMNAIAEVASELQASVERIASQPAPAPMLPGAATAVKGLPFQNTEALRALGVSGQQGNGQADATEAVKNALIALGQHPSIRQNVQSQTAIAELLMKLQ